MLQYDIFASAHIQYYSAQLERPIAFTIRPETRQLHMSIYGDQSETHERVLSITPIIGTELFAIYTTADDGANCLYLITDDEVASAEEWRSRPESNDAPPVQIFDLLHLSTLLQLGLDRTPDDTLSTPAEIPISVAAQRRAARFARIQQQLKSIYQFEASNNQAMLLLLQMEHADSQTIAETLSTTLSNIYKMRSRILQRTGERDIRTLIHTLRSTA